MCFSINAISIWKLPVSLGTEATLFWNSLGNRVLKKKRNTGGALPPYACLSPGVQEGEVGAKYLPSALPWQERKSAEPRWHGERLCQVSRKVCPPELGLAAVKSRALHFLSVNGLCGAVPACRSWRLFCLPFAERPGWPSSVPYSREGKVYAFLFCCVQ